MWTKGGKLLREEKEQLTRRKPEELSIRETQRRMEWLAVLMLMWFWELWKQNIDHEIWPLQVEIYDVYQEFFLTVWK